MSRPEVTLGLVSAHVPLPCVWRLLVNHELRAQHAPPAEELRRLHTLGARLRRWRERARRWRRQVRVPLAAGRSHLSWTRRRLHSMDEAILVCL